MKQPRKNQVSGEILEQDVECTLAELGRLCRLPTKQIIELVEQGIVEPLGKEPSVWRFEGVMIHRIQRATRLQHDLGINTAGIGLVLDLLEEIDRLRNRLHRLER